MAEAKSAMREFANTDIRYNKNMTDAEKKSFRVRVKDTVPTRQEEPGEQPESAAEYTENQFELKFFAFQQGTHSKKKPEGVHGVKFAWQVGGNRPASAEDLSKSKFAQGTSLVRRFSEADVGKEVFVAPRYENRKGDGGPWSAIVSKVIR